ncbi:MAG: hypothetical protein [Circular genetic element sp.]|nr:MAG: hypothetical protein [Circular genetic element sp.]
MHPSSSIIFSTNPLTSVCTARTVLDPVPAPYLSPRQSRPCRHGCTTFPLTALPRSPAQRLTPPPFRVNSPRECPVIGKSLQCQAKTTRQLAPA